MNCKIDPVLKEGADDALLNFSQSWLACLNADFRAGQVRFSWTEESLVAVAHLDDDDVFNPVTAFNEYAFPFGDVVEFFVVPDTGSSYYEIHAAPSGAILQLAFDKDWREQPRVAGQDPGRFICQPITAVEIVLTQTGWRARLEIPFSLLGCKPKQGDVWDIAACRYDYTRGRENPVLSSTALLPRADFHLLMHYNTIRFDEDGRCFCGNR